MCVGLPAQVRQVKDGVAVVEATGARRTVSAELIDDLEPGDYVMIHAGAAIARITSSDEDEADELLCGLFAEDAPATGSQVGA